ncbi:MAG: iron donor protein CyaY [Burkholderiaceae bacterium]
MSEHEFLGLCEALLDRIETVLDDLDLDLDLQRSGHVLEIVFDDDSRIVVNGQVPMREIWLASPAGAHHFRREPDGWIDTRSGSSLSTVLSSAVSRQSGTPVDVVVG